MGNRGVLKVFTWGTFDHIHEGHKEFLKRIAQLGKLYVIVIPSKNKLENSGYYPNKSETDRKINLLNFGQKENLNLIEDVFIDSYSAGLNSLLAIRPDIFCFEYDQSDIWMEKLMDFCAHHGLNVTFLRMLNQNGNGVHSFTIR